MSGEQVGVVRCGLDLEHESHEHALGWCDGGAVYGPEVKATPVSDLATLFKGVTDEPRPWAWTSLTADQAELLAAQLGRFADHYNETYVVDERHLLLGCWPAHPGAAAELAPLYAQWVIAHQGALATAELSLAWHDRWLRGFQERLPGWFGLNGQGCRPGWHKTLAEWNPSAMHREAARKLPEVVDLGDAVRALTAGPARLEL